MKIDSNLIDLAEKHRACPEAVEWVGTARPRRRTVNLAVDTAEAAPKPPCAFRLFGMMPPCVLPAGHEGDHQDRFGGYYGNGVTR